MGNLPDRFSRMLSGFFRVPSSLVRATASLSYQKDSIAGCYNIIATTSSGRSKACASINIFRHKLIKGNRQGGQIASASASADAIQQFLEPIAVMALLETIREVSGVGPVQNQKLLNAAPSEDMNLSFEISPDQQYGRGINVIAHLPGTEETAKIGCISLWFKTLRSDNKAEQVAEIFSMRFKQALTLHKQQEMDCENALVNLSIEG